MDFERLPPFLQLSIKEFEQGERDNVSYLDCLWMDLYSSINSALIDDGAITEEEADYLRNKYLWKRQ